MGELSHNSGLLTRYLLGDLLPDQQDSLEEKFFTENDLFLELLDAKDQLISNYLDDRLSAADHERFERHFLTLPDRRREVELAHFFRAQLAERPLTFPATQAERVRTWWQELLYALRANRGVAGAATAALLAIAVAGVWFATRPYPEPAPDPGAYSATVPAGTDIITLELVPGSSRSPDEVPKAVKGASTRAVKLKLAAGKMAFSNYRARLQRVEERVVDVLANNALSWEQTTAEDRVVTWEIPADKLPNGDYLVKLQGVNADQSTESIGTYQFKVREESR